MGEKIGLVPLLPDFCAPVAGLARSRLGQAAEVFVPTAHIVRPRCRRSADSRRISHTEVPLAEPAAGGRATGAQDLSAGGACCGGTAACFCAPVPLAGSRCRRRLGRSSVVYPPETTTAALERGGGVDERRICAMRQTSMPWAASASRSGFGLKCRSRSMPSPSGPRTAASSLRSMLPHSSSTIPVT